MQPYPLLSEMDGNSCCESRGPATRVLGSSALWSDRQCPECSLYQKTRLTGSLPSANT